MKETSKLIAISLLTFSGICNAGEWYEGGTLTDQNALIWQESSLSNKVASSADFVATMYQKNMFNSSISNSLNEVNDFAPYAIELAVCIDEATKKELDSKANIKIFANQEVSSIAALCLITMGWGK